MVVRFSHATRDATILRVLCLFTAILLGCTWRLWMGQHAFPQVPLLAWAVRCPPWIDNLASLTLLGALIIAAAWARSARTRSISLALAIASLAVLWITDQHRLQPWAYHFALSAWIFVCLPSPQNLRWLRLLMVSVYMYSALSKFDVRFLDTSGALFLETALQMLGHRVEPEARQALAKWALLLPLGEWVTGVLLAVRGLRRFGVMAAVAMHLSLIALLGPWGMNHRWGVLVWNASFLTQVVLLFGPGSGPFCNGVSPAPRRWLPESRGARVLLTPVLLALVLPLTEPWGLWDSWLSWGLYSTRSAKLEIYLDPDIVPDLPENVRPFCDRSGPDPLWARLAMDRWSLEALQAPIYPHERFELGVGRAVIQRLAPQAFRVMIVRSSPPDRRTGAARLTRSEGAESMHRLARNFRWNCRPRETQVIE